MKSILFAILAAFVAFARADPVSWDDVARVDFPNRNQTLFLFGCFSMYHVEAYVGLNCQGSTVEALHTESPIDVGTNTQVIVTSFDQFQVFSVDTPCTLNSVTHFPGYRSYAVTCYDDSVFQDNFGANQDD